ncbi:MAG TPA: hypothetical protein VEG44_02180 [Candidatus Acidoferrales bacterium]|nr:hypothetical protein [Candidatus Acidoferrales bacterium]
MKNTDIAYQVSATVVRSLPLLQFPHLSKVKEVLQGLFSLMFMFVTVYAGK